jgi:hypothetical protein
MEHAVALVGAATLEFGEQSPLAAPVAQLLAESLDGRPFRFQLMTHGRLLETAGRHDARTGPGTS